MKVVYKYSDKFASNHVDGVGGGTTPAGCIAIFAFSETVSHPESETLAVDPQTGNVTGSQAEASSNFTRTIHSELIMSREFAHTLHNWLGQQLGLPPALRSVK